MPIPWTKWYSEKRKTRLDICNKIPILASDSIKARHQEIKHLRSSYWKSLRFMNYQFKRKKLLTFYVDEIGKMGSL